MATTRPKPEYELACPKCGCTDELGVRQTRVVYCSMDLLDTRGWQYNSEWRPKHEVSTCVGESHDAECSNPVFLCYNCGYETRSQTRFLRVKGGTE